MCVEVTNLVIDSTAVDAGNTPTTELRAGLLLGKQTADGNLYQWNPDATDGTEIIEAVLFRTISMLDVDGSAEDKMGHVIVGGPVQAASLLIEGTAFTTSTAEHLARLQMTGSGRFIFDDDHIGKSAFLGQPLRTLNVITNTTVTAAHNGTMFVATTADCTFTLPTIEAGLAFEFLRASDHEMVVASAAGDDIIIGNDLSADSITFTTAGEQIGVVVRVQSLYVGSTLKWLLTMPQTPLTGQVKISAGTPTFALAT